MTLTIYTDGGSLNNPGEAAIAYVIYTGETLRTQFTKRIGTASNNVAEYTALIEALNTVKNTLKNQAVDSIRVFADSLLMVNQLNGLYKIKEARLQELHLQVKLLEKEISMPITYTHVLRDKNQVADSLVKKALAKSLAQTYKAIKS